MILNFRTTYPKGHSLAGQPTHFIAQIWSNRKKHTIRDSAARFEKSAHLHCEVPIQIYTGARTKNAKRWHELWYDGCQKVTIYRANDDDLPVIEVDDRPLNDATVKLLIGNDGFYDTKAFMEWMFLDLPTDVQQVTKYIIHWTELRY